MRLPGRLRPWRPRPPAPAPFVVGVPRSGTTLLRLMLDAHPALAVPPETHFVPELIAACRDAPLDGDGVVELIGAHPRWPTFELEVETLRERMPQGRAVTAGEALRAFYGLYAERRGKSRWGDKTPGYLRVMRRVQKALPEARFIHIIRDARDVALSMTSAELTMPDSVPQAARRWTRQIRRARAQAARVEHYLEVRYEQLVLDTEPTLRAVCEFVELGWDPAMLDYHRDAPERMQVLAQERPRPGKAPVPAGYVPRIHALTSRPPVAERVGRWRSAMSPEDRAACEEVAGELLAELGYDVDGRRTPAEHDG